MLGMDDLPDGHIENLPHSASIFHPSGRELDGLSSEIDHTWETAGWLY